MIATATMKITKRSTMQEVLEAYPSAQRALLRRYHIRGWQSCGYEPDHILEEVAQRHNLHDLDEMMQSRKHTAIVFYCHRGQRSLDAATYLAGHGFSQVRSMTGGIDAWSLDVDVFVPRYEIAPDPVHGEATLRPLRSLVSPAAGCPSRSTR